MYNELVNRLRYCAEETSGCGTCDLSDNCVLRRGLLFQAADAIEELQKPKWIPIESRPMDEEERQYYSEHFGYALHDDEAVIYCCELPDDGKEVLTCNRWGDVSMDTFISDPEDGCYFEDNGDMDGIVAWMRKPKPYEPPKEES